MKRFVIKTASVVLALIVLFSTLFAVPVFAAAPDGSDWWDELPTSAQELIYLVDNLGYIEYTGRKVRDETPLGVSKPYYNNSSVDTVTWDGSGASGGGSSGVRGTSTAHQSGDTVNMPIVSESYNTTTNETSYYLNMPSTTYNTSTNNYYNQYEIQNTYYNYEYNTYNFEVTNEYNYTTNYFLTYSPTYINITYLNSDGSGNYKSDFYFYQLPDGRNTWDLRADEVFGQYFVYDAVNYDMVVEADETMALYHFDGNLHDSSAYDGHAEYISGGSYNYVDHGQYNQALYWGSGEHQVNFDLAETSGALTVEMMAYFSYVQPSISISNASYKYPHTTTGTVSRMEDKERPDLDYYLPGYEFDLVSDTGFIPEVTSEYPQCRTRTEVYEIKKFLGHVVTVDGKGLFPVYVVGQMRLYSDAYCANNGRTYDGYGCPNTIVASILSASVYIMQDNEQQVGIGEWTYLSAVIDGDTIWQYCNGIVVSVPEWIASDELSSQGDIVVFKHSEYNNYWYLDELRVSSGALYTSTYTPQSHPFDTNKVMVLPDDGTQGKVAIKSSIPIASIRVGGARPTYPVVGDVFVPITKESNTVHKAGAAQQYQSGGWVSVDAAIYDAGEWQTLKDYNMRSYTIEEGDIPDPGGDDGDGGDNSGPNSNSNSGGTGGTGDGDEDETFWEWLLRVLGDFFGGILDFIIGILKQLVEGIITIVTSLIDSLWSLIDFVANFGAFIGEAFAFLPPEIISVIVVGLSLSVILMIVKFLRG